MARQRVENRRRSGHPSTLSTVDEEGLARSVLSGLDVETSAHEVLRWLSVRVELEASLCAVVDTESKRLVGLAGDGIAHSRVGAFSVDLEQADDPLVLALHGSEVISFAPGTNGGLERYPSTPFGRQPFQVIPLGFAEGGPPSPLGLLMLAGISGDPGEDVLWAARLLGLRLLLARFAEIQASERRARRDQLLTSVVLDSVTDPILLTDPEGRMLFANAHAERLLSSATEGSEGRQRAVALNNMLFSAALFTTTDHGGPMRRELLLVDPTEGQDLLYELISAVVRDPTSGVDGVVSVLRDVQDLRRATEEIQENYRRLSVAEAEVRAERDRLDLIINAVADPVLVTDEGGNIVLMNPPAERLFTAGDAPQSTSEHIIRTNDVLFSSVVSSLYTMDALRLRSQLELADPITGQALPFEAIAGKVISKQGRVTGVVTLLHDRSEALENAALYERVMGHSEELRKKVREATTELSQQNELLRQQALALEEASAAKSRFLANMSHELRTPLNAIIGYTDLFLEGIIGSVSDLQREKLGRVAANARHLVALIDDLLDIARIESGRMPVHVERFELAALIEEIMREVEPLINDSRLTVSTSVPDGLGVATTDRKKVKQIVLNLLSNAIKFTPEGFVRVRCSLDAQRGWYSIAVIDTGIGIPPEQQAGIFEEFHQVDDTSTRRQGGTGLGLAISKRLAEVIHGRIDLVSSPGMGSTFTLGFPTEGA